MGRVVTLELGPGVGQRLIRSIFRFNSVSDIDVSPSDTPSNCPCWHVSRIQSFSAVALLSALYAVLRIPIWHLDLPHHDDGETLYHALALLNGLVPYRDDLNHHFMGYVVPYVLVSKAFGFGPAVIKIVALITQVATAFGLYLCARFFVGHGWALLSGCALLAAREPWVLAFYVQYQINFFIVWTWFFCFQACFSGKVRPLYFASLLAGLAFCFDQRALALAWFPISVWALAAASRSKMVPRFLVIDLGAMAVNWAIFPILALAYLVSNDAFSPFVEQTFVFSSRYRAHASAWMMLEASVKMHAFLLDTPCLLLVGLGGFLVLGIRCACAWLATPKDLAASFLLLAVVPLVVMPVLGGRVFSYYTITWLPYFALLGVVAVGLIHSRRGLEKLLVTFLLCIHVALPLARVLDVSSWENLRKYQGDGMSELVEYLETNVDSKSSIYVWAYRAEVYVRLQRVSAYPFVNMLCIHPDVQITSNRQAHVYPKYERMFLQLLDEQPPEYLITFVREGEILEDSTRASAKVHGLIKSDYALIFDVSRKDFTGATCQYQVFRRSGNLETQIPKD